jgi:ABC-2 type transport system permease protein
MNASRIGAIVLRMYYLYRGSPQRVFPIFIFVAIDILVWGFLTRYLNSVSHADFNFVPALLGAVLLWDFLTRVMQQLTMTLFEDVWTRNFLNFFASPLRTSEYLIGLLIVAIITSGLSLIVMLILAQLAFGLSFFSYGIAIAPFLMVLFITGIALGVAAAALVLRLGPASEWLIWPIPMLISPFAGVFYPVTVLPLWMHVLFRGLSHGHSQRIDRPLQRRDRELAALLAPAARTRFGHHATLEIVRGERIGEPVVFRARGAECRNA